MRYVYTLICMLIATGVYAQEVAVEAAAQVPGWVYAVGAGIALLVGVVFGWYRKTFDVDTKKKEIEADKTLWEQRNFLIDNRLSPFAVDTAEHWLKVNITPILIDATDGDGFQWADHWNDLKTYVRKRVIDKFAAENVDIVERLSAKELDDLLDRVLLGLIAKLPESVQVFLPEAVVDKLTDFASEFAVKKGKELLTASEA